MTRINLIEPYELSDKHLAAENHEMLRPLTRVENAIKAGKRPTDFSIPERWKLGKGHELFFMDKLQFLHRRYALVIHAMRARNMNVNETLVQQNISRFLALDSSEWYNAYKPTPEEFYLNMARLARRSEWESTHLELIAED